MIHYLSGLVASIFHLPSWPSLFFVSLSSFLQLFCYCIQQNLFRSVLGSCILIYGRLSLGLAGEKVMVPSLPLIVILLESCNSNPFLSQVGFCTRTDVSLSTHCKATPLSLAGLLTLNPVAFAAAINTATTNTAAISTVFMSSSAPFGRD